MEGKGKEEGIQREGCDGWKRKEKEKEYKERSVLDGRKRRRDTMERKEGISVSL